MADASVDVAVVGLGAMGAATLWQLARRGVRAVGIDRFDPPHDQGSSHGESRITRLAVGEGPEYAPLVRRSHALWRELEAETGQALMLQTGGLITSRLGGAATHHGTSAFLERTIEVAVRFAIAHEVLDASEIRSRYPQMIMRGDETGYFEPEAGMLFPERCIAAQLDRARALGAEVRVNETVLSVREDGAGVAIETGRGRVLASRVVMAAGAWLPGLVGAPVASRALVHRQTVHWFAPDDGFAHEYRVGRFPVFIWIHGASHADYFYGFPTVPGGTGVKLGTETYAVPTTADAVARTIAPGEAEALFATHVAGRLAGVSARAIRGTACLYTTTPDAGFIVDWLEGRGRVLCVSACSGHGFKHSAAMGELLAQAVTDVADPAVLAPFAFARRPAY